MPSEEDKRDAVERFRSYLRINTMQPNPNYNEAAEFLTDQAKQLNLPSHVVTLSSGFPVVIISWIGMNANWPSLMLNSHIDVVPVFPDHWTYPPFSAHMDDEGRIFARGSQDMKCVGSQYLEAIRRIRHEKPNYVPPRSIHVVFVPDEEVNGKKGMGLFIEHDYFKSLNVGFCLDEGIASPTDECPVFYGERSPWWIRITCHGQPGHGSQFLPNTAGVKLRRVIDRFMDFRAAEEARLTASEGKLLLGDVTTVNLTRLEGGVQYNVVPEQLSVGFDIRITPHENLMEFESRIGQWVQEATGDDETDIEYLQQGMSQDTTDVTDANKWWRTFAAVCEARNLKVIPQIFPAATDSRYLRTIGIPAIGFSPMPRTPILLHDHNEYLHKDVFLEGIDFYYDLIPALVEVDNA